MPSEIGIVPVAAWLVIGLEPGGHLVEAFATEGEAKAKAEELGPGHVVRFGSHKPGTDEHLYDNIDNPGTS